MIYWSVLQHEWPLKHAKWKKSQKTTYYKIAFILNVKNRHIYRDRKQIGDCPGLVVGIEGKEEYKLYT